MSEIDLRGGGQHFLNKSEIQKGLNYPIIGDGYLSYKNALISLGLETLEVRRGKLSLKYAIKSSKHRKFKTWFKQKDDNVTAQAQIL